MNNRVVICMGVAALGIAAATSAQAQAVYVGPPPPPPPGGYAGGPPAGMPYGGLPPSEILAIVRASGLRPLTQPARQGASYIVLASDNMGGQLRVMISAQNGRIINAAPAYDPRFPYNAVRPRGDIPVQQAQPEPTLPPRRAVAPPPDLKAAPPPARTARVPNTPAQSASPAQPAPPVQAAAPAPTGSPGAGVANVPTSPRPVVPRPRPAVAANDAAATPPAAPVTAPAVPSSPPPEQPAAAPPPKAAPAPMIPVAPLD